MRPWNFITLDQIMEKVTSVSRYKGHGMVRRGFRARACAPAGLMLASAILCASAPASQIQPQIMGTAEYITVPVGSIESSESVRPPFSQEFGGFFTDEFLQANARGLRLVAKKGASSDSIGHMNGIVAAIAAGEEQVEWKPIVAG